MSGRSDRAALLRELTIERQPASRLPVSEQRRREFPRVLVMAALLLLGAGAGAAALALFERGAEPAAVPAPPVRVQPAASAGPPGSLSASGYIVPRRKATVSAEITGRVAEVMVDEGASVWRGQVLARLDDTVALLDLNQARAGVTSAQAAAASVAAELDNVRKSLKRIRGLGDFASDAALTRAESEALAFGARLAQAQAQVEVARVEVASRRQLVERHLVRAPFSGVIVDKTAQPGEIVSPMSSGGFTRTGVYTLVDMDSLEVDVEVNESNIGRIAPGLKATITPEAYPRLQLPGAVIAVVPTANRQTATIRVRVGLEATDPRILPDMAVKVTFAPTERVEEDGVTG